MRVNVEHKELVKGLVFKKRYFDVQVTVEFTEEQRQKISDLGIEDAIVLKRDPPADFDARETDNPAMFHLYVEDLLKGTCKYALHRWRYCKEV